MCLPRSLARLEGREAPAASFRSPVARDYPSCPAAVFSGRRGFNCSFKERVKPWTQYWKMEDKELHNLFTKSTLVDNW